jgi:hypothetical protein
MHCPGYLPCYRLVSMTIKIQFSVSTVIITQRRAVLFQLPSAACTVRASSRKSMVGLSFLPGLTRCTGFNCFRL